MAETQKQKMIPVLFSGTVFESPLYFISYFAAFLGAILAAMYKAKAYGQKPVLAVDMGMMTFITGILGARLAHVFFEYPAYYLENPLRFFFFWQGGFVLYGGIVVGILTGYLFLKLKKEPIGRWADICAAPLLMGVGIGRTACLAVGCCYGKPTDWFWGMIFTDPRSAVPKELLHIPLHPTQLLEILFCLIGSGILFLVFRKPSKTPGIVMIIAAASYALFRFFIEFLRGDTDRGLYFDGWLSTSQLISIIVLIFCVGWILRYRIFAKTR